MLRWLFVLMVSLLCIPWAEAAEGDVLRELTQKALVNNPDVLSHWHDFNAATQEIRVARGGFLPKVDLSSNAGNERLTTPLSQFYAISSSFYRDTTTLTLTQMLYDGLMTHDEVRRLNHVQLSRYYEWSDAMENSALETAQTYFDLVRYKALYRLSEENFVSHRVVYEQILLKVNARVGRAVDLEQIKGRLALSEANLVTDNANVHDANARLLRLVNEMPKREDDGKPDVLVKQIPEGAAVSQLAYAINNNPSVMAAVENVMAAQSDLNERRGKYQPRLDLVLSDSKGKNVGGVIGQNRDAVAQVVMSWNLFNGGSDAFRANQYTEQLEAARYKRDKACRDVRQSVDIAYHGVSTLTEQLAFLAQRQESIEKARYAYKKQFDLGQRSLLDLLDSENELYQAKRAYVNAIYDRAIDAAKTLAGMGKLVSALGLTRMDASEVASAATDAAEHPENCPAEASEALQDRKNMLIERAREQLNPLETQGPAKPQEAPQSNDGTEIIKIPAPKKQSPAGKTNSGEQPEAAH